MKLRVAACMLLLTGCYRASETPVVGDPYQASLEAVRAGSLQAAQDLVDEGRSRAKDPVAFQLLECEILLGRGQARRALEILEAMPPPSDPAAHLRWLSHRAEAQHKTGHPENALPLLDELDRLAGAQTSDTAFRARLLRGAILSGLGRRDEADEVIRDVAERAEAAGDSYSVAGAMLNFSYNRLNAGRYDDSLLYSLEAVKAADAAGALRLAGLANDNAGIAYTVLGDLTLAEQHLQKSVRQLRDVADQRNLADALGELGNVYLRLGDFDRARPLYEQAVQAATQVEDKGLAALWSGQLAHSLIEQQKWTEAEAANRRAQEFRDGSDTLNMIVNEADIARGMGRTAEAVSLYRSVLDQRPKDAYVTWMAHVGLAPLLAQTGDFENAKREYVAGLAAMEEIRARLHAKDYRIRFQDLKMKSFREYVELLVDRGEQERALQVAEFSRVRVLMENMGNRPETIGDVRVAALRQYAARTGTVLLSYWVAPKRSFVWVITAREINMYPLPGAEEIGTLVRSYRKAMEQDMRDPIATGLPSAVQLSKHLLDPIRPHLGGAKRVALVADGPLHALNFETLPVDGHYWIEDVEVSVAPSLTLVAQAAARRTSPTQSLLLVGAPLSHDPKFPALSSAGAEVTGIRTRLAGREQVVRTGAEATPTAFAAAMPANFSMIHFAAHAEANPQSPFESAVILSPDRGQYKLYARDIAEMKLNAELVTISACRSAGAQSYGGEGLVGFAWAFLHAGARSVIAGLWDVADASSAQLMTQVYEGLSQGRTPAAALREAKLSMLHGKTHRNPFYWAPYQTYTR